MKHHFESPTTSCFLHTEKALTRPCFNRKEEQQKKEKIKKKNNFLQFEEVVMKKQK